MTSLPREVREAALFPELGLPIPRRRRVEVRTRPRRLGFETVGWSDVLEHSW